MQDIAANHLKELSSASDSVSEDCFQEWLQDVDTALRKLFPDTSRYTDKITEIRNEPVVYGGFTADQVESQMRRQMLSQISDISGVINSAVKEHERYQPAVTSGDKSASSSNEIFIVHGHDEEMKQHVARTIASLELSPVILHEQPNHGRTIIEKFEANSDVGFAVVLLSPDDMAYPVSADHESAKPQARPNVLLELGYFAGKIGRSRVFALKRGNADVPSDFSGVVYTQYDDAGAWRLTLHKELRAAGYDVDANRL